MIFLIDLKNLRNFEVEIYCIQLCILYFHFRMRFNIGTWRDQGQTHMPLAVFHRVVKYFHANAYKISMNLFKNIDFLLKLANAL